MKNLVHVVHCIDTEGPLKETLENTFDRLKSVWGINIEATIENLTKLQNKEIDLGGSEKDVAEMIAPRLLSYNDTWKKLDIMLDEILSQKYRNNFTDSFNNGWVYNWFLVDHVGYKINPRKRDIGHHKIFDHYYNKLLSLKNDKDGIHFHFHPMPFNKAAHNCGTAYIGHSDNLYQILCRKIIERNWFPSVYRPGFHVTRPDSHWFLEQFIPIEYANQSLRLEDKSQPDLSDGRFGDWRRAPKNWQPYHPSHDDYQLQGHCRRLVARCLNIGTRHRILEQKDVDQAFEEANVGKPVILSFTHHDYRDMRPDIKETYAMLKIASSRYPKVSFKYCEAKEAVKSALNFKSTEKFEINLKIENNKLIIKSTTPTFGPQPFLSIKTKNGDYFWDNCDFQKPNEEWSYFFDEHTILKDDVETIGIASCDRFLNVCVSLLNVKTNKLTKTFY